MNYNFIAYFTTVVQTLFNLNLIQALAQISCLMSETQRMHLKELSLKSANDFNDLKLLTGFIIDTLEHSSLYVNLDDDDCFSVRFQII